MKNAIMAAVEAASSKTEVPKFEIGDTVDVHQTILDDKGKTRVQIFNGVVIARRGDGMRETFTVRRIVQGEGVERIYPVHSPKIVKVEVKRMAKVRRAKLFYLRDRIGSKATRLKERKSKTEAAKSPKVARGRGKAAAKPTEPAAE